MHTIPITVEKDIFDYALPIMSMLIAVISIIYTAISIRQQKKQWLNEYNIKRESEILIKFRNVFNEARDSIQFAIELLNIQIIHTEDADYKPKEIDQEQIISGYDKILMLYKLYKEEQYIYKKHGIDKLIPYIQAILDFMQSMTMPADRNWKLVERKDGVLKFKIINRDFYKNVFCTRLKMENQRELNKNYFEASEEEFDNYKSKMQKVLVKIKFKLESLTVYIDKRPKSFDYIIENFYPSTDTLRNHAKGDYSKNEHI